MANLGFPDLFRVCLKAIPKADFAKGCPLIFLAKIKVRPNTRNRQPTKGSPEGAMIRRILPEP